MGSSATQIGNHQTDAKECGRTMVLANKYHSFSSSSSLSSSSSSYLPDDSPRSPGTPFRFLGVPFSWEHLPGIPKKLQLQNHNKKDYSMKLLPLPPPTTSKNNSTFEDMLTRKKASESFRRMDPFFAALVECSKEDGDESTERNLWIGAKVTRSMSDRLGFISLYTSCKRTCAVSVSDSVVYLPRFRRSADHDVK